MAPVDDVPRLARHPVFRGGHPTLLPEDSKRSRVDVRVRGEGEESLKEIADALDGGRALAAVDGITYQSERVWHENPDRALPSLDRYELPARRLTERYRHAYSRVDFGPTLSVVSSRGCSKRCTFCSVWRFHRGQFRARSPENIAEEIAATDAQNINFDGFRSVLPTALPPELSYDKLANLYRDVYGWREPDALITDLPWYERRARRIEGLTDS